jgi:hypothetical protein
MPHLPPPTVFGGSVKVRIPVSEVNDYGERCGEPLFKKETKPIIEAYPPHSKKKYAFEQYSATDTHAKIYKIEIYGDDEDEVFEFRPEDGKCTIEIYYAVSEELPLRHVNKWLEPGEECCPKNPSEHEHEHE